MKMSVDGTKAILSANQHWCAGLKFKYHDGFQLSLTSLRRIHLLLKFVV